MTASLHFEGWLSQIPRIETPAVAQAQRMQHRWHVGYVTAQNQADGDPEQMRPCDAATTSQGRRRQAVLGDRQDAQRRCE